MKSKKGFSKGQDENNVCLNFDFIEAVSSHVHSALNPRNKISFGLLLYLSNLVDENNSGEIDLKEASSFFETDLLKIKVAMFEMIAIEALVVRYISDEKYKIWLSPFLFHSAKNLTPEKVYQTFQHPIFLTRQKSLRGQYKITKNKYLQKF